MCSNWFQDRDIISPLEEYERRCLSSKPNQWFSIFQPPHNLGFSSQRPKPAWSMVISGFSEGKLETAGEPEVESHCSKQCDEHWTGSYCFHYILVLLGWTFPSGGARNLCYRVFHRLAVSSLLLMFTFGCYGRSFRVLEIAFIILLKIPTYIASWLKWY